MKITHTNKATHPHTTKQEERKTNTHKTNEITNTLTGTNQTKRKKQVHTHKSTHTDAIQT